MRRIFILLAFVLVSCNNGGMEKTIIHPVTITFDTDGGNYIAPITVEELSEIKLPTPKKGEYEFIGWYEIRGEQKILLYGNTYTASHDATLYARFVIWYPFEVSNISHTITETEAGYQSALITWDNPIDGNFSHVGIATGELGFDHFELQPGTNTFYKPLYNNYETWTHIKCIDKNGNESKGIRYTYR